MERTSGRSGLLKRIKQGFSEVERRGAGGKGTRFPEALKRLALRGLRKGITVKEMASAAKITAGTIQRWERTLNEEAGKRPPKGAPLSPSPLSLSPSSFSAASSASLQRVFPIELRIEEEEGRGHEEPRVAPRMGMMARIELGEGITIEVPVAALTVDLLATLRGRKGARLS